jgi:hypothetical protein
MSETIQFIYRDSDYKNDNCVEITKESLYNGLYLYTAKVKKQCGWVKDEIFKNAYVPLIYSILTSTGNIENITDCLEILKEYVTIKTGIQCEKIGIYTNITNCTFIPFTMIKGVMYNIYIKQDDAVQNLIPITLNGYKYIGTSQIIPWCHKNLHSNNTLYNLDGIYLLKSYHFNDAATLRTRVYNYELMGYWYSEDPQLKDLSKLWPITVHGDNIYSSETFTKEWCLQSCTQIRLSTSLTYTLTGIWQFTIERNDKNCVKLLYNSILAYIQCAVRNNRLTKWLTKIRINSDLSITAHFDSWSDVELFKLNFHNDINGINVIQCKNIGESINIRKYITKEEFNDIVFSVPYDNSDWVVWTGNFKEDIDTLKIETIESLEISKDPLERFGIVPKILDVGYLKLCDC